MPTYRVKTPIKLPDGLVKPGEEVEITVKEAAELLRLGAVEAISAGDEGGGATSSEAPKGKPKK